MPVSPGAWNISCHVKMVREGNGTPPSTLAWKINGQRSLVGCSPWGRQELDTTERLHFHFSLSCIGEGNGNPLQCSYLENPRDGEAWWAAVYGVLPCQLCLVVGGSASRPSRVTHVENSCRFKETLAAGLYKQLQHVTVEETSFPKL